MDIASMLEREDFYTILRQTLLAYYRQVHNREIRVEYQPFDGSETLYVFSRLSFISRKKVPAGAREFLYSEFNIRGNKLKYMAGKLLVFLATHSGGIGAVRKVYITKGVLGQNAFISPQNRSVRIFDYDTMTVDCIVKSGFTSTYFANQLAFRKTHRYDFVPALLDCGDTWFRERIMRGHALARVTDEQAYTAAEQQAVRHIAQLACDTLQTADAGYVHALAEDVRGKLARAKAEKHVTATVALREIVDAIEARCAEMPIPLVVSHGDLQSGNIWLENDGRVWIYDWETQKRRSVWYDSATLLFATRRAGGLERMMASECADELFVCDGETARTPEAIRTAKDTVLLEDMLFYLEDMLELPGTDGADIFELFATRIQNLTKGA